MTNHILKVHPQFWDGLASGAKPFEVRRNDRGYKIGDILTLKRYDPAIGFTGEETERAVSYVLQHEDMPIGVPVGFCVLGLNVIRKPWELAPWLT